LEALVGKQGWIDPASEVSQVLEGIACVRLNLIEHATFRSFILPDHRGRQPHLHRECDELLLGPVVQVALDLPSLFILGGYEPLSGSS